MPKGFKWCSVDIADPAQLDEMYNLLNGNYVEDDENTFRFVSRNIFSFFSLQKVNQSIS